MKYKKFLGVLLILIGVIGLILPIIPGLALIALGSVLILRDKKITQYEKV